MMGHRDLVALAKEARRYAEVGGRESEQAILELMRAEIDTRLKQMGEEGE